MPNDEMASTFVELNMLQVNSFVLYGHTFCIVQCSDQYPVVDFE